MDTALSQGDFAVNAGGVPFLIQGEQELLQQAKIRLAVPKGAFCYDTELGSRLYTLNFAEGDKNLRAKELAAEALLELEGVTVTATECQQYSNGEGLVRVTLSTPYGARELSIFIKGKVEADGDL